MPVSDGYLAYILDQLRPVVPGLRARRMFSGIGLYAVDLFFGIVHDDVLYLKVDDATRGDYEARGMPPFRPFEVHASMSYSQLPEEILEERETLQLWTGRSLDAARAAKSKRARRKGTTKRPVTARGKGTTKRPAKKRASKKAAAKKSPARKSAKKKSARKRRPS
ncbi:MAG TPA: TfoX/Sxy family protein [Gemmatimonadaceae bacterium]